MESGRIATPASPASPSRRGVLAGLSALGALLALPAAAAEDALEALEARHGGRLGVFALDTGSGHSLAHRADERFLLCSTSKFAAVAAVLARVDAGTERLDRRVAYDATDTAVGYAPETKAHLAEGGMSLEALCRAAIVHSDNGAANLILASLSRHSRVGPRMSASPQREEKQDRVGEPTRSCLGGPAAVTRFVRGLGDETTRFDRTEPTLNHPDGILDTTTPRAYAATLRAVLLGEPLSPASRGLLDGWMVACDTGRARLRAGVPPGWTVGDKTGTAGPNAGDVALLRPPGRAPIVVAAYYDVPGIADAAREAVLKAVGTVVAGLAA